MMTITFLGWKERFNKVGMTKLLMEHGLRVSDAKHITDQILEGEEVSITIDDSAAEILAQRATDMGVSCRLND